MTHSGQGQALLLEGRLVGRPDPGRDRRAAAVTLLPLDERVLLAVELAQDALRTTEKGRLT